MSSSHRQSYLAALVLEPNSDDPGTEGGHLNQLLLHQRVWPGVRRVAGLENVELLLAEDGAGARRLSDDALVLLGRIQDRLVVLAGQGLPVGHVADGS